MTQIDKDEQKAKKEAKRAIQYPRVAAVVPEPVFKPAPKPKKKKKNK